MQQDQNNMLATHLLLQELLNQSGQKTTGLLGGYPNVPMYAPEITAASYPLTRPLTTFQLPSLIPTASSSSSNTQEHSSNNSPNYTSFQKYQPPTQSQTPKFTQASQQTIIAAPSVPIHKKRVLTPSQEVQFKREFALEIQCKQSLHRPKMREFVKKYSTPDCTFTWQQLERLLKRKREQTRRKNQKEVQVKPLETPKSKEVKHEELAQQLVDLRRPALPSLPSAVQARDAAPLLLSFSKNPHTPITLPKLPNASLNEVKGAFQVGEEGKHALEQLRALAQLATNELKPEMCTPKFPKCSPRRFDIFNLVNTSGRDSPTIAV